MSNTLYRKYRPQQFSEVIGQKHIIKTLTNALKNNRLGQAYLFTGPRGTGKTTTARLLAKAVTCTDREGAEPCLKCPHCLAMANRSSLDVIEIDAASNTGVDNIRELRDSIKLLPTQALFKVYIIDEVHMLSIGAFNALLKTLEEPPKHVIFILATTSLHKVPETILSRCQRFDFSRLPLDHIIEKLSGIAVSEGVTIDKPALEMIALAAEGGMRDAESLLMQVISLEDKTITTDEVSSILGITDQQKVEQFIEHIAHKKTQEALLLINQLVENGADLYIFTNSLLHSLRQILLISIDATLINTLAFEMTQERIATLSACTHALTTPDIITLIDLFSFARKEIRLASIPQLPLEIVVIKFLMPESIGDRQMPISNQQGVNTKQPTPIQSQITPPTQAPVIQTINIHPENPTSLVKDSLIAPVIDIPSTTLSSSSHQDTSDITSVTIDTVKEHWQLILDKVREWNSSLALTLGNCRPLYIGEGGSVVLGAKFPMYKDKINAVENKLTVESAFDTILESKTKIKVVLDESATPPSTPVAQASLSPLLTEAMSILGGKIVA
jgi:DNA polymerase III subunit gamma/tau